MLKSLFQRYLNYSFRDAKQGILVRVLERPGLWMETEELARLTRELRKVAEESIVGGDLNYGVFTGSREALGRSVITLISDEKTGEALAFNALAYMNCNLRGQQVDVLHLGLVVVSPNARESGFSWILYGLTTILLFVRSRLRPLWISNVTQVPAIIGKVSESFRDVYPTPTDTAAPSIEHLMLARQILRHHRHVFGVGSDAHFDERRFVIENAYTGGSDNLKKQFSTAQPHRREIYNDFCQRSLNYDRGDDFLQIGLMDMGVGKKYLLKSVPAESLGALLGSLVVVVIQGVLLPVVEWFDSQRHQGEIRPWS